MPYLFNLVYLLLIVGCAPWLLWAAMRKGKYRAGWAAKFLGRVPRRDGSKPRVWFHAVSVGEVNLVQPLLVALKQAEPDCDFVVSTTTRTGYALAQKRYGADHVFYCPLDFSWAVRAAMRRVRPDLLVLVELELWPNLIRAARDKGVRVAVVNGRLSARSYRGYRRIRPIVRRLLHSLDLLAVQNRQYASRFRALGAPRDRIRVTGSVKFDGALSNRDNPATRHLRELWKLTPGERVFLAGSTQAPEEQLAVDAYRNVLMHESPAWRLIIVPRHPERFEEVATLLDGSGLAWQRRSKLDPARCAPDARVLLVDVIGELGAWWGTASAGFVGGSLGRRGGQNMIEPAAYGVATCFGPHTENFRDVVAELLKRDAAVVVRRGAEIEQFLLRCAQTPDYAQQLGQRARQMVLDQQGAADRTVQGLLPLIRQRPARPRESSRHVA